MGRKGSFPGTSESLESPVTDKTPSKLALTEDQFATTNDEIGAAASASGSAGGGAAAASSAAVPYRYEGAEVTLVFLFCFVNDLATVSLSALVSCRNFLRILSP